MCASLGAPFILLVEIYLPNSLVNYFLILIYLLSSRFEFHWRLLIKFFDIKSECIYKNHPQHIHQTSSCSSCLSSSWKCNWCMKDNRCASNENQCTATKRNALTAFSSHIQSIDACPKIHNTEEIRIPNGVSSEVYLQLINLPIEATHSTVSSVCIH